MRGIRNSRATRINIQSRGNDVSQLLRYYVFDYPPRNITINLTDSPEILAAQARAHVAAIALLIDSPEILTAEAKVYIVITSHIVDSPEIFHANIILAISIPHAISGYVMDKRIGGAITPIAIGGAVKKKEISGTLVNM